MPGGGQVGGGAAAGCCCEGGCAYGALCGADIPGTGNEGRLAVPINRPDCTYAVPLGADIPGIGKGGMCVGAFASAVVGACASV